MFSGSYLDWNQKKIKVIVEHYGHPYFVHKKVLDLGCGHGDIGGVLHRLGAEVTAVDARQDHLKIVSKKYAGVKTVKADLDSPWPFYGKKFDLTIDIALLCYLRDFEAHLKTVCASSTYLILETAVLDSNDPNAAMVISDGKNPYDGSFNGFNSQVSAANIERVLKECGMSFKRIDNAKLNSGSYVYDWQVTNNNIYDNNKRRLWFCVNEVANSQIANQLPANVLPPVNSGVFSPQLIDSKIPVAHQRVTTSRSPAPPPIYKQIFNTTQNVNVVPRSNISSVYNTINPNAPRMRLFFNYYIDKNPARQQELDLCLQKNLNNTFFDLVIVESENNPTFDFLFQKINLLAKDQDISIICNSDIFFDQTVKLADRIKPGEVYALTRWDFGPHNQSALSKIPGQDAWIIRGKIPNVRGDFPIGKPGSDLRINYEFQAAGYKMINPGKALKIYHNHQSGIRHYTEQDRIQGHYLTIDPTNM